MYSRYTRDNRSEFIQYSLWQQKSPEQFPVRSRHFVAFALLPDTALTSISLRLLQFVENIRLALAQFVLVKTQIIERLGAVP